MRNAFIDELIKAARVREDIVLIIGDLGYSVIEPFADEFPDRFFNAGIAEQNMMGMAAGMASEGMHVFTYSIGNFPTWRCAEQIRNDVDYHNLSVTNVVVGGGVAYGSLGYSHHAIQDYALMRSLPNMLIAAPGDPMETRACMHYLLEHAGPSYLRLGKAGEANYHLSQPEISPGRWLKVRKGSDKHVLLSTGFGLQIAMKLIHTDEYSDRTVYSMPLWSMEAKSIQASQIQPYKEIITIEDHLQDCGFGSWLLESIVNSNDDLMQKIKLMALGQDVCSTFADQQSLVKAFNRFT